MNSKYRYISFLFLIVLSSLNNFNLTFENGFFIYSFDQDIEKQKYTITNPDKLEIKLHENFRIELPSGNPESIWLSYIVINEEYNRIKRLDKDKSGIIKKKPSKYPIKRPFKERYNSSQLFSFQSTRYGEVVLQFSYYNINSSRELNKYFLQIIIR